MSHNVFISYSNKDKPVADGICANVEAAGLRCWIAPRDIAPGEDFPTAIANGIAACQVMVLVFSQNANMSDEVSRELYLAANNKLVIIPFIIEHVKPEAGKAYYIGRTHWLDAMNPPTHEQITQLIERIKTLMPPVSTEGKISQMLPPVAPREHGQAPGRKPGWLLPAVGLLAVAVLAAAAILVVPQLNGAANTVPTQAPGSTGILQTVAPATQSGAGDPGPYLYREDFNDAQFDGSLPPNVSPDPGRCDNLTVVQAKGSLTFEAPAGVELMCGVHVNIGSVLLLADVKAVEFALGTSPETALNHPSFAFMLAGSDADNQKSLFMICGLNSNRANCVVKKEQQDVYRTKDLIAKPGETFKFRIEVLDPNKMSFRFVANEEMIGEYAMEAADAPLYKDYFFGVGGGPVSMGKTATAGTYLMDYVSVEQR